MSDESRDNKLIRREGEQLDETVSFERRLKHCQRLVFQIAYSVLGNSADAEEVTQDVFFRAYRKLPSLRDQGSFRAWVARMSFRLALNRCRAAGRARRRETAWYQWTRPTLPQVEQVVAERESYSRLRAQIDRLPKKLSGVLLLSAVDELDRRDIARILQIPDGTVRSRLHLARKSLLKARNDGKL